MRSQDLYTYPGQDKVSWRETRRVPPLTSPSNLLQAQHFPPMTSCLSGHPLPSGRGPWLPGWKMWVRLVLVPPGACTVTGTRDTLQMFTELMVPLAGEVP